MHIHITPRHLKLTGAIHGFVAEKIEHLEHATDQIIGAHVVLWHDHTRKPTQQFRVKVHLAIPGPDIFAEEAAEDLYAAVDMVVNKLSQQLRKRKTKVKQKTKIKAQKEREQMKRRGEAFF
ncbi:MAG: ribosome-associated translation inhibitor RaiA [bacterium]